MKRRWLIGAWALLGSPAVVLLVGFSEQALYLKLPESWTFLYYVGAILPGACIGLGLLAILSLLKSGWSQRIMVAAAYGALMYILAEIVANPILQTHAVLMDMPR